MRSFADAVNELLSLHASRQFARMESRARDLLDGGDRSAIVHELLGMALAAQNRYADALASLRDAVEIAPDDAQFWENLALCQRQLGQFVEAEAGLRKSLALRPNSPATANALGSVLRSLHRHEEALELFRLALSYDGRHDAAEVNLGNTLRDLGRMAEAEASYRRAIAADPTNARSHCYLGIVLNETGRHAEAGVEAEKALALIGPLAGQVSPANLETLDLAALVFAGAKQEAAAAGIFRATLAQETTPARALSALMAARSVCDWMLSRPAEAEALRAARETSIFATISPFRLLMVAAATPADQLAAARSFAAQFVPNETEPLWRSVPRRAAGDRVRVGYFSGDFCDHPVSQLLAGVFEAHDRAQFEIVAYDYSAPVKDAFRARIQQAFDRIVPLHGLSYRGMAERIAQDGCDIAIDLTGWTGQTRSPALARRPAPVQVQWLGYPGTMGAPWIDYIVADEVIVPPGEEANFGEKVIRLPGSFQPNDDRRPILVTRSRKDYGLPERSFVLCCFNQPFKITPEIFEVWMRLLRQIEGGVLWLLGPNDDTIENLRREAGTHSVDPSRLIFAARTGFPEHLARHRLADLFLDTVPYNAGATANSALWAGLPVLTARVNDTFVGRMGASLLRAAGLPELVATSLTEYEQYALKLARDPTLLESTRRRLDRNRTTFEFFDSARFTRKLEAALSAVWHRHAAGLPPDHIHVE